MTGFMINKFTLKILMVEDKMLSADVAEVVVDTNIFLPSMFTVVIEDNPTLELFKYTDLDPRFKIGAPVSIGFETTDRITGLIPIKKTVIKGEITSIEPIFSNGRAQLRIRGYDRTHRLMRGKKTRAFLKMNETMIITKIASEAGLMPVISGTPTEINDYVLQYNQSNWEFLSERAQLFGYQIYADGMTLKVSKADSSRSFGGVILTWKENLSRFEPRIVSMGQVTQATVIGWDPDKRTQVKHTAMKSKPMTKTGELLTGSATALMTFGQAEDVFIPDMAIRSRSTAKTIAQNRFDENQSQFIKASGELALGEPNLIAGAMAIVKGVGLRFSGTYYITEARHIYRNGEYTVQFQVSGRNPYTVRHLLNGDESSTKKMNGVVVGKITSLRDPDQLGRVKVSYPWMPSSLSEVESNWARLAVPSGGKERGFYFSPEVDDEVLIAFENGDMNYPYVVGSLWNKVDKPPKGTKTIIGSDGKVAQRVVRSSSGHVIILDDTSGQEQIIIQDKTNKNSIVIDSKTNAMTIKAEGDLTIEAGGKLTIKSKSDFSIKSETKGAIEANQSANIKAGPSQLDLQSAGAAIKGTNVDVQATAKASVKGNAMVEVQGGMVKIN